MTTSNAYQYINLEYMELMADGDDSMKKIMLEMLLDELPSELEKMRTLTQENDWDRLGKVSHKMKSTLAYVGNDDMTVSNKTIETICKTCENVEEVPNLVTVLETNFQKVLPELQNEFNRL